MAPVGSRHGRVVARGGGRRRRPADFPARRGQVGMIKMKPLTHVVGSDREYMMPFAPIG